MKDEKFRIRFKNGKLELADSLDEFIKKMMESNLKIEYITKVSED